MTEVTAGEHRGTAGSAPTGGSTCTCAEGESVTRGLLQSAEDAEVQTGNIPPWRQAREGLPAFSWGRGLGIMQHSLRGVKCKARG